MVLQAEMLGFDRNDTNALVEHCHDFTICWSQVVSAYVSAELYPSYFSLLAFEFLMSQIDREIVLDLGFSASFRATNWSNTKVSPYGEYNHSARISRI